MRRGVHLSLAQTEVIELGSGATSDESAVSSGGPRLIIWLQHRG